MGEQVGGDGINTSKVQKKRRFHGSASTLLSLIVALHFIHLYHSCT